VELHEQDTIAAGDGLCDREAVRTLVEDGPRAIQELIDWGAEFDREGARLLFAREGAHSRSRVLHAHGDSTGREIARTLYHRAASLAGVEFRSFSSIIDLLSADGAVAGAVAYEEAGHRLIPIHARAVLLATGGLGRVFKETTNPDVATGDGVAAAFRAGAVISDLEFVQFHPTALFVSGAPRFLLSEALRGEGAHLLNAHGERFMDRYSPMAELAPRDVVSRAILAEMHRTDTSHVFLDLTHRGGDYIRQRFPRIYDTCRQYGVDLARQPAPVHPAAHYAMGGVKTDLDGRTTMPRLFAAGEVACTGVHGANRLASNSLLEGVVFGARAGRAMLDLRAEARPPAALGAPALFPVISEENLRRCTWENCGLVRSGETLESLIHSLSRLSLVESPKAMRSQYELRNMHTVALAMARCALARQESRGGHYRTDFPEKSPDFQKHSLIQEGSEVRFTGTMAETKS
jgi:L-aspartate oxidase